MKANKQENEVHETLQALLRQRDELVAQHSQDCEVLRGQVKYAEQQRDELLAALRNVLAFDSEYPHPVARTRGDNIYKAARAAISRAAKREAMTKEGLTEFEQAVKDNLSKHMPKVKIEDLTEDQKFSAARTIARLMPLQDAFIDYLNGYLGLRFKHIFVGIEKDGYAHS